ncbi:MAG TPA: NAD(+) kinase, partial [Rubrivivax sp.]|nr:NAD(+) kinase [Rubrivivax sp.]
MATRFVHAAIVGRYQTHGIRALLEEVAQYMVSLGLEVCFDAATARNTGVTGYEALTHAEMGEHCDLAVVVGGDGTMLGIAR